MGRALAAKTGAFLKLGMLAVLLLAASGAGYYYVMHASGRDTPLENVRRLQRARADPQMRLTAEQRASEQQQKLQKTAAQDAYQACLTSAAATHDASWAAECKRLAEKMAQDHAECLAKFNLPKTYCDAAYAVRDGSLHCTLPAEIATVLDADLEQARNRCERERKAAEQ